jgi:hypothetical protein
VKKLKAYILNRYARNSSNYTSWMADCPYECKIIDSFPPDWQPPEDAGIVVTHLHYRWEEIATLRRIYEARRVPILILADGVLEYRNTWQNPNLADGAVFQPLFGHKMACLGAAQVRTIERWGNSGKCEIVGLPRLDTQLDRETPPTRNAGPFRLLVATATTPAFTLDQRATLLSSLKSLKQTIESNPVSNGRPFEVTWRLTDGLDKELEVETESSQTGALPALATVIDAVDAVITTPSTLYLESILRDRPTAVLDFSNSPAYVPAAWTINAVDHFAMVLSELKNPPPAKMRFQRSVLRDQLAIQSPAAPRLIALIQAMVNAGVKSRANATALSFPDRILPASELALAPHPPKTELVKLYPENPAFQTTSIPHLQQELNHAVARLAQLPRDLDQRDAEFCSQNAELDNKSLEIENLLGELKTVIRTKNADLQKKDQHIQKLMEEMTALSNQKNAVIKQKLSHIKTLDDLFQATNSRAKSLTAQIHSLSIRLAKQAAALSQMNQAYGIIPVQANVAPDVSPAKKAA